MRVTDSGAIFTLLREREMLISEHSLDSISLDCRTITRNGRRQSPKSQTLQVISNDIPAFNKFMLLSYQFRQRELSRQAKMALKNGECTAEICRIINEALAITAISESDYAGKMLFAHEPELLHTRALLYAKEGDVQTAIAMLKDILLCMEKHPDDDNSTEEQTVAIMLSLAQLQMQNGERDQVLKVCDEGLKIAARRANGMHCPDFMQLKIFANPDAEMDLRLSLLKTYTGFVSLNRGDEARKLLIDAQERLSISIETYGMETIVEYNKPAIAPPIQASVLADFTSYSSKLTNLGSVFKKFREISGVSSKNIYNGICKRDTFMKILSGHIMSPCAFMVEALAQRMGMTLGKKLHTLLVPYQEMDMWQLRDEILSLAETNQYSRIAKPLEILKDLESKRRYPSSVLQQFIFSIEATVYGVNNYADPEYLNMLKCAISKTIPNYNYYDRIDYPLTAWEAMTINQIAIHFRSADDLMRAAMIYDNLLNCIDKYWLDEDLKSNMYAMVSFNYSSCLGQLGERQKALAIINKAIELIRPRGDLFGLLKLFYNKGFNMYKLGDKDESLPWFVSSYYGIMIFENQDEVVRITRERIKTNFEICL